MNVIEEKILKPLNPQQREAVMALDGPVLIVAGAGSGKTRAITHRMAWLIAARKVPAWNIFAATFTNKAAGEMRHRVLELLNLPPSTRFSIATFHSHCAAILRREAAAAGLNPNFTICDESDQLGLIKKVMRDAGLKPEDIHPAQAQWFITQCKMKLQSPDAAEQELAGAPDDAQPALLVDIYRRYQNELEACSGLDFEDLIVRTVDLFRSRPEVLEQYQRRYQFILIDEYQDTNFSQFVLIRLLADAHKNVCVVGDEDQSIYSWRGAEITNLLEFPRYFPGARIIKLERNYRSHGNILKAAGAVIANNRQRIGKTLFTDKPAGPPLGLIKAQRERDEAESVAACILRLNAVEGVPLREMAVFYRANSLSRNFEDALRANGIAYTVVGGVKFYDRAEIKDCLAYLRALVNPDDVLSLVRIINKPARGIGVRSVEQAQALARQAGVPLYELITHDGRMEELSGAVRNRLAAFGAQLRRWSGLKDRLPPSALMKTILDDTGYLNWLKKTEGFLFEGKRENVEELISTMKQYETDHPNDNLHDYLNAVALTQSVDEYDRGADSVSLMTVHSAKGLEFDTVFIVGLEDGVFPSRLAVEQQGDLEEERRLFYVALTRARRRCFLSFARSRMMFGQVRWSVPSPFLYETPRDVLVTAEEALDWAGEYTGAAPSAIPLASDRTGAAIRSDAAPPPASVSAPDVGREVRHPFFGPGRIVDVKGTGRRRKLVIAFADGLVHEILEAYAQLEYK
ncbi:MAG: UvrD-helicase domain-containing protein [Candidatus Sumerlaeia bacterium]